MPELLPAHLHPSMRPLANPAAVVTAQNWRFTVLTDRCIRVEYSPSGQFEDRASQAFWFREQAHVPEFEVTEHSPEQIMISTRALLLTCDPTQPYSADALTIEIRSSDALWTPGTADTGNLFGTYRTLDMVAEQIPLEPGLLSRDGWTVIDDSNSLVFNPDGLLAARQNPGAVDVYFLGYGRDYKACLTDYAKLSGAPGLLPRYALGNWWSRYWEYTDLELQALIEKFQQHEIPLSVCIIDMDWHITKTGNAASGWTGYTWNRNLFPDPARFIGWLHGQGLKTALNVHPADGVWPHEEMYERFAARLNQPVDGTPVKFAIHRPDFIEAYFEELHHTQEAAGVDFWWIDWQQGTTVEGMPELDPLWWLNHLHYYDLARDGQRRPFTFSRWGGLGNQRYPIGFSGDSLVTWAMLAFQPYMTATAANVGFGWWSHDINGHFNGVQEPELYTRWVQFGVFSPIVRLHSTKQHFEEREPWGFDANTLKATREALQLRHQFIPYLYTLSHTNAETGLSPITPMYHEHPDTEEAYHCPNQYLFGAGLIAAPHVTPADREVGLSRQVVWLPDGDWYDFTTGQHYAGGWHAVYSDINHIPVFSKAGAIIPLAARVGWGGVGVPDALDIVAFAGKSGEFTLFEDDGETTAYQHGASATTRITQTWEDGRLTLTVEPATGDLSVLPAERSIKLIIRGVLPPDLVQVLRDGIESEAGIQYDGLTDSLLVGPLSIPQGQSLSVTLTRDDAGLLSRRDRRREAIISLLKAFRVHTHAKDNALRCLSDLLETPALLAEHVLYFDDAQRRALFEVLADAGLHRFDQHSRSASLVVWNNREDAGIRFNFNRSGYWRDHRSEGGTAPRTWVTTALPGTEGKHLKNVYDYALRLDFYGAAAVEIKRDELNMKP